MDFGEHYWKYLTARLYIVIRHYFDSLNFEYQFPAKSNSSNKKNQIFYLLHLKEVDLIPFTMVQDFDNLKHMEIVPAIWIDPLKLLQPWPEEQSRLEVTTRPFQPKVCITFLYLKMFQRAYGIRF